jgi:hypothetical protein
MIATGTVSRGCTWVRAIHTECLATRCTRLGDPLVARAGRGDISRNSRGLGQKAHQSRNPGSLTALQGHGG